METCSFYSDLLLLPSSVQNRVVTSILFVCCFPEVEQKCVSEVEELEHVFLLSEVLFPSFLFVVGPM